MIEHAAQYVAFFDAFQSAQYGKMLIEEDTWSGKNTIGGPSIL